MKVAVLGVGRMGMLHARLLRDAPLVEALVLADLDAGRAREASTLLDAEALSDPIAALEKSDAVIIATPPGTHASLVTAAVQRGRPVLCEKPLAEDLSGAIALATFVESNGVPVQVGFHRRFDPGYVAARSLVERGDLGRLHLMRLQGTEPVAPRSSLTNLFRNTAIHDFDMVRWLSGTEVASVYVEGSHRAGGEFDTRLDPDTIAVTLRLVDGALGVITVSRLSPLGYDVRTELIGTRDHIVVGCTERAPVHSVEPGAGPLPLDAWRTWQARFEQAYRAEQAAFLAAATGARPVTVTVRDGVEAQRISEAARRSLETGRRILMSA
ncbi:MAG TPA: Gfo/Idh/MocA family oxidoreductase [Candidatus Saccharimonadales bacterium]|nr:Gfo/Idh/MocA family oxidoreductase [Candidatus Saccharimonadales bacterium]